MRVVYNKHKAQGVYELSELKSELEEIDLILDSHSDESNSRELRLSIFESDKNQSIFPIFKTIRDIIIKLIV